MLYVIAGHGDGDCGACGNGYQEAERVRALASRIKYFGGENVILCDFNINAYKDNIIGMGKVPTGCKIVELHMDSSIYSSSKGGHVIINTKNPADKYDIALAKMISSYFPGRSNTIVARNNLANVNRSLVKGYNYRLIECGFISNYEDIKTFNTKIDEIAKDILTCFNIPVLQDSPIFVDELKSKYIYEGIDYSSVFNPTYYSKKYKDLKRVFGSNKTELFRHFVLSGMKEGRNASSNFNVKKYRKKYSDLQKAFGDNFPSYYKHYIQFGKKEGRTAK